MCTLPKFQSTHPLRGATYTGIIRRAGKEISIHAPLAGCDRRKDTRYRGCGDFNPRTPCGVRPEILIPEVILENFNPRTPCGVRLGLLAFKRVFAKFQSTHPLRGATILPSDSVATRAISIHAPLAGCDGSSEKASKMPLNFNPRTPCGVRRVTPKVTLAVS